MEFSKTISAHPGLFWLLTVATGALVGLTLLVVARRRPWALPPWFVIASVCICVTVLAGIAVFAAGIMVRAGVESARKERTAFQLIEVAVKGTQPEAFTSAQKEQLIDIITAERNEANFWTRFNEVWDVGFRVALLAIGVATTVCSGLASQNQNSQLSGRLTVAATILAASTTALSAFAFSQLNFASRVQLDARKEANLQILELQLRYLRPKPVDFVERLGDTLALRDIGIAADIPRNGQTDSGNHAPPPTDKNPTQAVPMQGPASAHSGATPRTDRHAPTARSRPRAGAYH